jgi:DNA-binding HxlR family transcriptional regulator
MLRLLGAGAGGAILMALGAGPLRTKELTGRIHGYTPRTVYRYSKKLVELGLVERHAETGVPSKVVHNLTEPAGRELFELIDAYADVALSRLPNGEIDAQAWGSLSLLADLWESGLVEELNLGPRTPTELARLGHGLTYHQVNRRAGQFAIGGFLHEGTLPGKRRVYSLSDKARRGMALVAGIGRWRRRHLLQERTSGLSPREIGGVLRTALPLVSLPEHAGKDFGIEILPEKTYGSEGDAVWASVGEGGAVRSCEDPPGLLDGHLRDRVPLLVDAILDGPRGELKSTGDGRLVRACLERLHAMLWTDRAGPSAAAAEAVAGGGDGVA